VLWRRAGLKIGSSIGLSVGKVHQLVAEALPCAIKGASRCSTERLMIQFERSPVRQRLLAKALDFIQVLFVFGD